MNRQDMTVWDVLREWWWKVVDWPWGTTENVLIVVFVSGVIGLSFYFCKTTIFQSVPAPAFSGTILDKACYDSHRETTYYYDPNLKTTLPRTRYEDAYCVLVLGYSDEDEREYQVRVVEVEQGVFERAAIGDWYEDTGGER